ncbi:MAG: 8-amino-7-oxononanoate synthase [Gemmatimonadetes bacterium]|nr:8-amino-7-oxononanoate synthase [Gemmatimonadota bacterium]
MGGGGAGTTDHRGGIEDELHRIHAAGLHRSLHRAGRPLKAEIVLDGRRIINFSSNDSLGLATDRRLSAAVQDALVRYGVGSGASRLVSGNMHPHEELECKAASYLEREKALLFNSGYQANIGAIPALAGRDCTILSDELNHASLIDGIRLARAECRIYPHNDTSKLRRLLIEAPADHEVLVVTESLFSMEGDRSRLEEIVALKGTRPFMLYLDEAHALGATGPSGRGLAAETGCADSVDVVLGTLGKAFGASGAFVAARSPIVDLLLNRARSFIYSTAPMPAVAAAGSAAIDLVRDGRVARQRLRHNTERFREAVLEITGCNPPGIDHIVPVFFPGVTRVMKACADLLELGIYCQGIRPPTVPAGSCRLRFSISAAHDDEQLDQAAAALGKIL